MSRKRRNTSSPESDGPPAKRRSPSYDSSNDASDLEDPKQRPQIDPVTGQSGAFPGLTNDEEVFHGPAANGIDYLRMVRTERKDIPETLTSIEPPKEDNGGYWQDGAYTARPEVKEEEERFGKAQRACYTRMLQRFNTLRTNLRRTPPLSLVQSSNRPISFPSVSTRHQDVLRALVVWGTEIREQPPHPVQVACMDADSILNAIQYITEEMPRLLQSENIGAWIWAILARCPERGELGSEEISDLRAFAKRAIEMGEPDAESESGDLGVKERRVLLDLVVTVVGELYGQRDLLELRKVWKVDDE